MIDYDEMIYELIMLHDKRVSDILIKHGVRAYMEGQVERLLMEEVNHD